ncbi:bifunctional [glutamate--ammonia ligase]-adenylyl-L-tyrosine phosphorylase/[glutamate--ammonia-ligase] adenylyltransferase [Echinimonas agarilytica]|uniref:Bifunctional glutamine synthetase adenylyltransferase/adenylyl-removing enzyme n=1 Tax=Echinimonas agarilytica TaxID=1215918 RepID=A0AA41W7U9_9GAMM|nr:bifunctional [glutamate--ammonia ligase]-adenylyl-L-tyrosine phosphorylase/[glutamate--ammonia-ligase] adenylyltransferase [Echinimonas agarilytica]MCM2680386.1 bifunctional [glutamate--ammonia ligase]-adenylyl-L-tyrosine phosphorylase/[glutamate--ammonia-ligase] adenylyltransferase [Echinimonas agarilytica]
MAISPLEYSDLTPEIQEYAQNQWLKFEDKAAPLDVSTIKSELTYAFALSDFIYESFYAVPQQAVEWLQTGSFEQAVTTLRIHDEIATALESVDSEASLMAALRRMRRKIQSHIIWRDMMGLASLDEVLEATSALADEAILQARDWLQHSLEQRWGVPTGRSGSRQTMFVIGMGKLGGCELNVSSDVDLIFTYSEAGATKGARKERDNQEFFIRLGQRLINVLNQTTVDGSLFVVDMRLRPFGDSGPLVMPFSAFEDYYQHHGREWERYAMVKGRVLGPKSESQQELAQLLQPFVYRRYIDFSAFQSLRKMKLLIQQEVKRRQLDTNIKLGAGGIREVEFVAQSQQLIRGGREPELRVRNLLQTLATIEQFEILPDTNVTQLAESYRYLRKLEHMLQGIADEQTQTLPADAFTQSRIAAAMGHAQWQDLLAELAQVRGYVHQCFDEVIGEQPGEQQPPQSTLKAMPLWPAVWEDSLVESACEELVTEHSRDFYIALQNFYDKSHKRQLGPRGRDALEHLMPKLLGCVCELAQPAQHLAAILGVIEPILTRATYLELLVESEQALAQLVLLCSSSGWIASELARHPMLLDELLDPAQLVDTTELDAYQDELRQFMLRVSEDDLEQQMEGLRHFKQIQQLRIAAADVTGTLPVMKVSDHLTRLAEVLLGFCIHAAWSQLKERFGTPEGVNQVDECLSVIGYGKLGGLELGYGSDLDIVFFHLVPRGYTNGAKSIDTGQFFAKLVQRVSHIMTTRTHSGELYEIDLRLRPSGASGVLVTHLDGFANYQREEAWVWEHQALVRARAVFGQHNLLSAFADIRQQILCLPRVAEDLAQEVVKMRHKMRDHLGSNDADVFDLKQDAGGIADIEFLAQFLVLNFSNKQRVLSDWPDNVRIFETANSLNILSDEQSQQLTHAYISYRNRGHRLALQCEKAKVPNSEFLNEREQVKTIWRSFFNDAEQRLLELERTVE